MDIVKAFNSNELHTEIVIKGDTNNPLFRASDVGNVLDIANIRTSINDFNETEKVVHTMDTLGGTQQVTFLTEKGLYKVLFKSRKPIAEKFQNWVCEVIKEIRLNGIYDLQKELEQQKIESETKLLKQKEIDNEKFLLKEYTNAGSLIYIIKVKTLENNEYVVKIGRSDKGILNRYNDHKISYKECLLLDCFAVDKNSDFENFIHYHKLVFPNKYKTLEGHEKENELFLIGNNLTYKILLKIINDNISNYNYKVSELLLENELLKTKINNNKSDIDNKLLSELLNLTKTLAHKISSLEQSNKEILDKLNFQQTKVVTGFSEPLSTIGPRLQKIHPESLQLIKVYETVSEAMKEELNIKRPSINKAIIENTIYCGFRWQLVERNLDPNIIQSISPTKQTKVQSVGYIAQLNSEKTKITNIYLDRKTAAHFNCCGSTSTLDNYVKKFTLTKGGSYYKLYDNCDEELKEKFEKENNEPLLYKNGVGQFDLQDNLIKEFSCKYDCIKSLSMSDKTLAKALNKNIPYNGFYFKELGSKLKML